MKKLSTGINSLDSILAGGLIEKRNYLIRGDPGSGKTTLGLHFLHEGISQQEQVLYITFAEPVPDIRGNGRVFNFEVDEMEFLDLSPGVESFDADEVGQLFDRTSKEVSYTIQSIKETVQEKNPARVLVDPVNPLRYLFRQENEYRKCISGFIHYLKRQSATTLFTSQSNLHFTDNDLQYLTDGIINLRKKNGVSEIEIGKYRGSSFQKGTHTYDITRRGITINPASVRSM